MATKKKAATILVTKANALAAALLIAAYTHDGGLKPGDSVTVSDSDDTLGDTFDGITGRGDWVSYSGFSGTIAGPMDANGCYPVVDDDEYGDHETSIIPFWAIVLDSRGDGTYTAPLSVGGGEYKAAINKDGTMVEVGCQNISFKEVEAVYNAMKAKQPKPAAKKAPAKKATTKK